MAQVMDGDAACCAANEASSREGGKEREGDVQCLPHGFGGGVAGAAVGEIVRRGGDHVVAERAGGVGTAVQHLGYRMRR